MIGYHRGSPRNGHEDNSRFSQWHLSCLCDAFSVIVQSVSPWAGASGIHTTQWIFTSWATVIPDRAATGLNHLPHDQHGPGMADEKKRVLWETWSLQETFLSTLSHWFMQMIFWINTYLIKKPQLEFQPIMTGLIMFPGLDNLIPLADLYDYSKEWVIFMSISWCLEVEFNLSPLFCGGSPA